MKNQEIIRELLPEGRPRSFFFTGKGGVGKTTVAAATAVWFARQGYRTLLVTTDPAAHLTQSLGTEVSPEATAVPDLPTTLFAARVDPDEATERYKKRVLDEARAQHGPEMLAAMKEELESPCTEEIAAFERFVDYFLDERFEVTVFDTAPTGHTLRLIGLSDAWGQKTPRLERVTQLLRDPERVSFALVLYPEHTPIAEAGRASRDLAAAGIGTSFVVANQVLPEEVCNTSFFIRRRQIQLEHLGRLHETFSCPVAQLPLMEDSILGLPMLTQVADRLWGGMTHAVIHH